MCALFGWLDYKGILSHRTLKRLTQALANAAEERGTDASGISYVKDRRIVIFKQPKKAHRIHFNPPDGTYAVMGHTRMTTQGSEKLNYNNHPFPGYAGKQFALAHNGVLFNDDTLRKMKNLPVTRIQTDSYVAVQLIERQRNLSFDSLRSMAEDVRGNFTFTVLDEDNSLYIIKGSNPMFLVHFESLGLYVYASTKTILYNALNHTGMQRIAHKVIQTTEGDIIQISQIGNLSRSHFMPQDPYGFLGWHDDDYDQYTPHEQLLMDYCHSCGIDCEDVALLLEYGYTADEIEDLFTDHDMLLSTLNDIKYEEYAYENECDEDRKDSAFWTPAKC